VSENVLSVAAAAERLKLHPKTILRFIREGRLRATRVGRQYRILQSDLAALAGEPERPASHARVTAIVDVAEVDAETARDMAACLPAARAGGTPSGDLMSIDLAYDPARRQLKVVLIGAPGDVAAMLSITETRLVR
jgi:excisionase family DNA binding protein